MLNQSREPLKLGLPKGRMEAGVTTLLAEGGIQVTPSARSYRPVISWPDVDTKVLKPQNIVAMLAHGRRDIGFVGADWVAEMSAEVVEIIDTGLDPVTVVAAAPPETAGALERSDRRLVVTSEYEKLARGWIESRGLNAEFARSFGATEVFPPEDADVVIDNTATGATLRANNLVIIDRLLQSSTRLCASVQAMENPEKRRRIEDLGMVISSVLTARERVMVEVNSAPCQLEPVVSALPAMDKPTVAPLYGEQGFSVKAAIPRRDLPTVIPAVKKAGGRDIVVTSLSQIVP